MREIGQPELLLLPSLPIYRDASGRLFLTQKYLDGVAEHAKSWPGKITSLVSIVDTESLEMDLTEVDLKVPDCGLEIRPSEVEVFARRLEAASVVTGHLAPGELPTAEFCYERQIPVFFTSEYTPRTEAQIIDSNTRNPILRMRRKLWIQNAEKVRQRILRNYASGLQCSGTPTYDRYHPLISNTLLFFDNRVRSKDVISDADLAQKCARIIEGHPLRLVFGGRLIPMKGVLELPRVARRLIELNIPFTLDIVGNGPLEGQLRREMGPLGEERIRFQKAMDFRSGWVPFLQNKTDLFLCCHLQGDPSSTYPEVMSCGVPIVGYANEAWGGLLGNSGAGWSAPIGDSIGLARRVAMLHGARNHLVEAAQRGRDFAREHCFEKTFARRTTHLAQALTW